MKKKGVKERLKRLSLYGLDLKGAIRAFMHVDPDEVKALEEQEKQGQWISDRQSDKKKTNIRNK
jgi:preprotein translocase subunit SecD